jgi:CBS domain-containing protein
MPTTDPRISTPDLPWAEALAAHRVFGLLSPQGLEALCASATERTAPTGERLAEPTDHATALYWLLAGEAVLEDLDRGIAVRLFAGDWFGHGTPSCAAGFSWTATAAQPTRLLRWPQEAVAGLREAHPELALFLWPAGAGRSVPPPQPPMRDALPLGDSAPATADPNIDPSADSGLINLSARQLVRRKPVVLDANATVQDAAARMQQEGVSSVLLLEDDQLVGVLTDRDLRNRVVAAGVHGQTPVRAVATASPLTATADATVFDVMLLMARHHIHHVPVTDATGLVGMLTATDLLERQRASPVQLASEIHRQPDLQGLVNCSQRVTGLLQQLTDMGAGADRCGRIVTAMTDAFTTRLVELAEDRLGPPPVPCVWVAAGSQARQEQTAKTDQDNALVMDDAYDAATHGAYFEALARWVCDGLAACGYIHCPGDMMAMNPMWRQPLSTWMTHFDQWIRTPNPQSLMLTSVFFDQRAVCGHSDLLVRLRKAVLSATRGNSLFLAHMVGNALKHTPPIGVFGQLTFSKTATDSRPVIDLKHQGVVPIIDLARVYALAGGLDAVHTGERLRAAGHGRELSADGARDLLAAWHHIGRVRQQHQVRQIRSGQRPDNCLVVDELSPFERGQLKDAFLVVKNLQAVLRQRYG